MREPLIIRRSIKIKSIPSRTKEKIQFHNEKAASSALKAEQANSMHQQKFGENTITQHPLTRTFQASRQHHTDAAWSLERAHVSANTRKGMKPYKTAVLSRTAVKWNSGKGKVQKAYVHYK